MGKSKQVTCLQRTVRGNSDIHNYTNLHYKFLLHTSAFISYMALHALQIYYALEQDMLGRSRVI